MKKLFSAILIGSLVFGTVVQAIPNHANAAKAQKKSKKDIQNSINYLNGLIEKAQDEIDRLEASTIRIKRGSKEFRSVLMKINGQLEKQLVYQKKIKELLEQIQ